MRTTQRLLLGLALSLLLVACGDDSGDANPFADGGNPFGGDPSNPLGFDPDDPDAGRKFVEGMMESIDKIELNEKTMQSLYDLAEEMQAVGDNPVKGMALARKHGWNFMAYGKAMLRFEALKSAAKRGPERFMKDLEQLDERLAEQRQKIAAATGDEKAALEQMLKAYELGRPQLVKQIEDAKKLADPEFKAWVMGWAEKFDALHDR